MLLKGYQVSCNFLQEKKRQNVNDVDKRCAVQYRITITDFILVFFFLHKTRWNMRILSDIRKALRDFPFSGSECKATWKKALEKDSRTRERKGCLPFSKSGCVCACLSAKVTQSDTSKYQPRLSVVDLSQVQLSQHKGDKRVTEPCAIISPQS